MDLELEDFKQVLRIKVWRSLEVFDAGRSSMTIERYVFSCVTNQVKDALKIKRRGDLKRKGGDLHIEDFGAHDGPRRGDGSDSTRFAVRYFSVTEDEAFADMAPDEQPNLPSSLTFEEQGLAALLIEGFSATECASEMQIRPRRVRALIGSIQTKMLADRPDLARAEAPDLAAVA